jgi:hypothetical protein
VGELSPDGNLVLVLCLGSTSVEIMDAHSLTKLCNIQNPLEESKNWFSPFSGTFLSSNLVVLPIVKDKSGCQIL